MTIFDQRYQRVNYQYNAAGDINIGAVQNRTQFIEELEKLKAELSKAAEAQVIDDEVFTDADYQLTKAIQKVKKEEPERKTLKEHLTKAKSLVEGATSLGGLAIALDQLISLVSKLL